ncbi:MAG TPA: TonB-dependent receptor [Cytophagales bacterium]|nr:TonB-dependent receptor [Cytophagales bacterium]
MRKLIPLFRDKASPHIPFKPICFMMLCLLFFSQSQASTLQKLAYSSQGLSPAKTISLDVKDELLSTVLERIERLSGYSFIYSNDEINSSRVINFHVKNEKLESTLRQLFSPLNIEYQIVKSKIILKSRKPKIQKKNQEGTVTGKVSDEKNESLPGVTVLVRGTTIGTATDIEGNYSLAVPDMENSVLVFSYIGFNTEEVPINGRTIVNIDMMPNLESLNEVVVVGYATQKKINLTGAVDMVDAEALESKPVNNITQALQGTSPNLIIQQQSSEPGTELNINIRGIGTLGDNSPLIVIDGIPSNSGAFSTINPNDIASISVLKDAASAAIYGSRSANGVILVTTKQGNYSTKPTVTYNGILGWQTPSFFQRPVSAYNFAMLKNEALINSGQSPQFSPSDINRIYNSPENDWYMDEIFREYAPQQSHNLSVSGGTENTTYLISVGRMDQASSFVGPDFGYKRTNARANITTNISKKLKTGLMVAYTKAQTKEHAYSTEFIVADASRIPRLYPIKDSLGRYYIPPTSSSNSLARLQKGGQRERDNDNIYGNVFAEFTPIKNLKIKGVFGANLWDYQQNEFRKTINYLPYVGGDGQNSMNDENNKTLQTNAQLVADYSFSLNRHNFGVLGGYSSEGYSESMIRVRKINVDNEVGYLPTLQTEIVTNDTYNRRGTPWSLNSLFGRVNYNFSERYLLEGNFRYDGSSRFAPGKRWGFYPSVSAGWRITEEPFLAFIKENVGNVKLRGSWGQLGNQSIDAFRYTSTIANEPNRYGFNNQGVPGASFSPSNPEIVWETSTMIDIGTDVDLFNRKLSLSFDYFKKRTEDILLDLAVPGTYGADPPTVNAAVVDNEGWEFALSYKMQGAKINHSISANVADNLNTVIDTKDKEVIEGGDRAIIMREGYPHHSYYGYKSNGLYQNTEEIEAGPKPGFVANGAVLPGDIRYVDKNGDGIINEQDRFVLGNPFPRYTFGFNYTAEYMGFDLNIFIQGVGKRNLYLRGESVEAFHNNWENVYEQHLDRWTPTNPDASYPRLTIGTASTNNNVGSDYWLLNAAYVRLKNVQLGYTIPGSITNAIGVKKVRFYITGHNLITLTKMNNGFDPEISEFNSNLDTSDGKVNSGRVYPNSKVYALGLDINF